MATLMLLFAASCTQEEIIPAGNQQGRDVSLSVNIPVNNPVTRAVPSIPQGYKLRCILQLIDGSNNPIADQKYVNDVPAGSESTTFTFKAPGEAYKCLFWADYVKAPASGNIGEATDNIYTTTDLKAIGYTPDAGDEMFNNDAADAFYGVSLDVNASTAPAPVTLIRPFAKITMKSSDAEYTDYDKIKITKLPAPTGFNVLTGKTDKNAAIVSGDLAIEGGKWFSAYLFTSSSAANLGAGNDIEFTLTDSEGVAQAKNLKFAGTDIPLTQNTTTTGDVKPGANDNVNVDVTFPGDLEDPNKMQVGDFIYKDGTFGKTFKAASETNPAIGIVFALKTDAITDASEYNKVGKKIAGYAMGLTSVTRLVLGKTGKLPDPLPTITANGDNPWTEGDYNGFTYTNALLTEEVLGIESQAFTAYQTWLTDNAIDEGTTNLSSWYIPSGRQIQDIGSMLFGYKASASATEVDETVKNATFRSAYDAAVTSLSDAATLDNGVGSGPCWIMSSYVPTGGETLAAITTNRTDTAPIVSINPHTPKWGPGSKVCIRPVLTIFEAE